MAKNLLLALFLCTLPCSFQSLFAINEGNPNENKALKAEVCNAPTPDSFRITSIGSSFISLAWQPAWVGATHFLSVSEKNTLGEWTPLFIFPEVPSSSYVVSNLEGGKEYRFRIATKCSSDDPSELSTYVDGIALIVELTLAGRIPKNPTSVNCHGIEYLKHHWVGFRVTGDDESNTFEFVKNEVSSTPFAYIRRVRSINPIVAANSQGIYPNDNNQSIPGVELPIQLLRLAGPLPSKIGFVDIIESSLAPNSIDICNITGDPFYPWKNGYSFTALIAEETIIVLPGGGGGTQGFVVDPNNDIFIAPNPFWDDLQICFPDKQLNNGNVSIRLLNTKGQVILSQMFDYLDSKVLFPMKGFSTGIYILQIETSTITKTIKVIKSE